MAYGGSVIARLILDSTSFVAGMTQARAQMSLMTATINSKMMTPVNLLGNGMNNVAKNTNKAAASANAAKSSFSLLGGAMGMVRMAGSFLASMLLFELVSSLGRTIDHTMKAQQEMRALFKTVRYGSQNLAYSVEEIKSLEAAIDKMGSKYKKINKYMIGEIVADVAVQGGLNAKETEKLIEPANLVYEMFRRGGRTPEMAKIAIREISEGEIRRLTLETGVGREELTAAGWSGDTNDKVGMFEALLKVAKDRNWDKFALKLMTIDDVTQLLTNTFSYMAVTIGNILLPVVVGLFNAINDLATAFTNLPGGVQIAVIGAAALVLAQVLWGALVPALYQFQIIIWQRVIPAVIALGQTLYANPYFWVALAIVGLIAVIYELGKAWGWWTDLATFGEAIWAGITRLFTALNDALHGNNARMKEYGSIGMGVVTVAQQIYLGLVSIGQAAYGVISWFNGLVNAMTGMEGTGSILGDIWKRLGIGFQWIMGILGALKGAWDTFVGGFYGDNGEWLGIVDGLKNGLGALWDWLANIDWAGILSAMWDGLKAAGSRIWEYIFGGELGEARRERAWLEFVNWFESIEWGALIQSIVGTIVAYNPAMLIIRAFFGDKAADDLYNQVMAFFGGVADAIMWVANGIMWAADMVGKGINAITGFFSGIFDALFGDGLDPHVLAQNLFNLIGSALMWSFENIGPLIAQYNPITLLTVLLFGPEAGELMMATMMEFFQFILTNLMAILWFINGQVQAWITVFQMLWITLSGFMTWVWNGITWALTTAWNAIYGTAMWVWNGIYSWIYNALLRVYNAVVWVAGVVSAKWNSFMSRIYTAAKPYIDATLKAWNQFKNGLVNAANYIRDKVWGPINELWTRLKDFWNWISNPGNPKGGKAGSTPASGGGVAGYFAGVAGSTRRTRYGGGPSFGIFDTIKDVAFARAAAATGVHPEAAGFGGNRTMDNDKELEEYLQIRAGCGVCGPYDFGKNWIDSVVDRVKNWSVSIGGIKFSLSSLAQGGMGVFTALATKLIQGTSYEFYYNGRYSDQEALARGRFNCFDGAEILIHLANALGIPAHMGHGAWNGVGHVWATVGGKVFDTTAFQHGHGWKSPSVTGYDGAGPGPAGGAGVSKELKIEINIDKVYGPDHLRKMMEGVAKEKVIEFINEDPAVGL